MSIERVEMGRIVTELFLHRVKKADWSKPNKYKSVAERLRSHARFAVAAAGAMYEALEDSDIEVERLDEKVGTEEGERQSGEED